jgi:hypothetical protein
MTKINRQESGVNFNANMDKGGLVVGDDGAVTLDVEMFEPGASK